MKVIPVRVDCSKIDIPLYSSLVRAGFPSPADDYLDRPLDLNEHLIRRPASTYFARAQGKSMIRYGIFDGDLLVVDRSLEAKSGHIIVAAIEGELTCKVLDLEAMCLRSGNKWFPPIQIREDLDVISEGVVRSSVRYHI